MTKGYYVTIARGRRVGWLLGPFDSEPEARQHIPAARAAAEQVDPFTCFDAFGVGSIERQTLLPGVLNDRVEVAR